MKKMTLRILFLLLYAGSLSLWAQPEGMTEEDLFFALPSPHEILTEAEAEGLVLTPKPEHLSFLREDYTEIAVTSPVTASFGLGRILAVGGFNFSSLNQSNILMLAKRIFDTVQAIPMPKAVSDEISKKYREMMMKSEWNRTDLMLAFTGARSTLMYLMRDPKQVTEAQRKDVEVYLGAVESGLIFQGLYLALGNLDMSSPKARESFKDVFLWEDTLNYLEFGLTRAVEHQPDIEILRDSLLICAEIRGIIKDGKATEEELKGLLKSLEGLLS